MVAVLKKLSDVQTFKTLKHEVCHRVLHLNTSNRDLWLNEGIAENCEFAKYNFKEAKVVIGTNHNNRSYVEGMARDGKLLPVEQILSWNGYEYQSDADAILRQVQAGEFISYLLGVPEVDYWLRELLGQDSLDIDVTQMQIKDRLIDLQSEFEYWLLN